VSFVLFDSLFFSPYCSHTHPLPLTQTFIDEVTEAYPGDHEHSVSRYNDFVVLSLLRCHRRHQQELELERREACESLSDPDMRVILTELGEPFKIVSRFARGLSASAGETGGKPSFSDDPSYSALLHQVVIYTALRYRLTRKGMSLSATESHEEIAVEMVNISRVPLEHAFERFRRNSPSHVVAGLDEARSYIPFFR
jgi:hypothetical protein